MGKAPHCCIAIALTLLLLLPLPLLAGAAEERANKSSLGGIFWATGKDESDLLTTLEAEDPSAVDNDSDELAGGFSSLDSMLQWAIGTFNLPPFLLDSRSFYEIFAANFVIL